MKIKLFLIPIVFLLNTKFLLPKSDITKVDSCSHSDTIYKEKFEEAFEYIKNDSLFTLHHSQFKSSSIGISNIYIWNKFFWDEIIETKIPNLDSASKSKLFNIFLIVKRNFESKESFYNPPLENARTSGDIIFFFSFIQDDLFTVDVCFLDTVVYANDMTEIIKSTSSRISYLFCLCDNNICNVYRKVFSK